MCPGGTKAASEDNRSVSTLSLCQSVLGDMGRYSVAFSVEGAQFLFTALCQEDLPQQCYSSLI